MDAERMGIARGGASGATRARAAGVITDRADAPSDLKSRILVEATGLFAERGYSATSVREVAERCGCTKPAVYYHFGSKQSLYLSCVEAETTIVNVIVEREAARTEGSVRERMVQGLRAYLAHIRTHPMGMRLCVRAELRPEEGQPAIDFASLRSLHEQAIQRMLAQGIERGEIRQDVDLVDATFAVIGLVDQRLQMWLQGVPLPQDLPERLVGLFFDGVAR